MHLSRWLKFRLLCGLAGAALAAHAAQPVTNTLTVHRIVIGAGGIETAEPAGTAKPGDLLEYVAEFHNNGPSTARGLSATLPLPVGTEFISASPLTATPSASVDGIVFEAIPLKRLVNNADGTTHEEMVPLREYRFVRWPATELAVGGALSVSARVAISTATAGR